ncbi:MAG TPA: hypothetical protein PK981_06245 [Accumulibacter sp.]|nr:hypothetical protein [Accumulibacter sp.]HMX23239.1 hypothetical protein [Accumulibacter sp.]HNG38629.1 hypothetical protein [Accumulibacter sp.]HNL13860.1 hypothetical protein [Accumulibacter sp.]
MARPVDPANAADRFRAFGSDLRLTRYVGTPSALPLDHADSWGTLDLALGAGGRGGLPLAAPRDLLTVAGRENLGQALILRLLTPLGDLAPLGHPTYGSRLTGLIGRTNDSRSRHLARLYVLEALAQESRVAKLLSIRVDPVAGQPDTLRIALSVLPRGDDQPLALALEVTL